MVGHLENSGNPFVVGNNLSVNVLNVGSVYASENLPRAAVTWMALNLKAQAQRVGVHKL
ncbi:MAG TPA: hypothetical protein VG406_24355 [Isosphaeraceae bacterium]|nr:hypothetical protein [Isosphaeraceae bacterium]